MKTTSEFCDRMFWTFTALCAVLTIIIVTASSTSTEAGWIGIGSGFAVACGLSALYFMGLHFSIVVIQEMQKER
jgi:uncharacterized membrane protein YhdT